MKKELSPTALIGIIVGVVVVVIAGVLMMVRNDPASRGPHAPPHFDPAAKATEAQPPFAPSGVPKASTPPAPSGPPGAHPSDSRPVDPERGGLGARVQ